MDFSSPHPRWQTCPCPDHCRSKFQLGITVSSDFDNRLRNREPVPLPDCHPLSRQRISREWRGSRRVPHVPPSSGPTWDSTAPSVRKTYVVQPLDLDLTTRSVRGIST